MSVPDSPRFRDGSVVLSTVIGARNRVRSLLFSSQLYQSGRGALRTVDQRGKNSRTAAAMAALWQWVEAAWVYRWGTREPRPEPIVVDLRDSVVLGPPFTTYEWLQSRGRPAWTHSGAQRLVGRLAASLRAVSQVLDNSRVLSELEVVLLPPVEPADEREGGDPHPDRPNSENQQQSTDDGE